MLARSGIVAVVAFTAMLGACASPKDEPLDLARVTHIPVELAVGGTDGPLSDLVAATLRYQLQHDRVVYWAPADGAWRMEVTVEAPPRPDESETDDVVFSLRVVDLGRTGGGLTDGAGHPTDSILGGTIHCKTATLWETCSNVVHDVSKVARIVRDEHRRVLGLDPER